MFGRNEQVGARWFTEHPEAQAGKLLVTSVFFTLQGEGPFSGLPALFVRLAHCNLACAFCDTAFSHGNWYTLDELGQLEDDAIARFFYPDPVPCWTNQLDIVYVITGGEPCLQRNVERLIRDRQTCYRLLQIETNGLFERDLGEATVVVSPKVAGREYAPQPPPLLERADALKFVLEAPRDGVPTAYSDIPEWAFAARRARDIYISPMNAYLREPRKGEHTLDERTQSEAVSFWEEGLLDRQRNRENHEWAAQFALRRGLRLSLQTHLYASLP